MAFALWSQAAFAAACATVGSAAARSPQYVVYAALNFDRLPVAAAAATFWQSAERALRLLGLIAGLFLIPASQPCFAAAAAAEFPPPALALLLPPELDVLVDELPPPELDFDVEVLLLELVVFALLLFELLLPQPATKTLPAATSASTMTNLLLI